MNLRWRQKGWLGLAACLAAVGGIEGGAAAAVPSVEIVKPVAPIELPGVVIPDIVIKPVKGADVSLVWSWMSDGGSIADPSGPATAAADGTVYLTYNAVSIFGDALGKAIAFGYDGKPKWSADLPAPLLGPAVAAPDGTLYASVGTAGGDGAIVAVGADGKRKWSSAGRGGAKAKLVLGTDGTVYATEGDGTLSAIRPEDGSEKWRLGALFAGTPRIAIAPDGTLYVAGGGDTLASVTPDGRTRWIYRATRTIKAGPAVGPDGSVYIATDDRKVHAVTPAGSLQWRFALVGNPVSLAAAADGTLYAAAADPALYAVAPDGKGKWKAAVTAASADIAVGKDGMVYMLADDGRASAFDPADGHMRWRYGLGTPNGVVAPGVGRDGTVYAVATQGVKLGVYALRIKASSIVLNKTKQSLAMGGTTRLSAIVSPVDATNKQVAWTSSNAAIAAVDDEGNVKGVSPGTAIVAARSDDGGLIADCEVTVMAVAGGGTGGNGSGAWPGSGSGAGSDAGSSSNPSFSDTKDHWASKEIERAFAMKIVKGYPDGTFRPEGGVTRAEFAVMLMNALQNGTAGQALAFEDRSRIPAWAAAAISRAVALGIVGGYPDGTFRPAANVNHAEMAAMTFKASGLPPAAEAATAYEDDADIPDWARGAVSAAEKSGIIVVGGRTDGDFAPGAFATRAEAAAWIVRMLDAAGRK
ncbi:PQQ-binding-like beta-propeller repeat protein [Cohnella hashimotonis]|uniref:S-layer homology domain-containing protein n=1 Tax=Cohnella hashimotonis TaxID=2826895 RepID=A0ABT6TN69_9BACL|nr:S-layer homology domain-containing protein [Cohnella hashimotonis]MDI4648292.1 S-layer homology domain-containing protein [Cohnella hashimotonis]